jgi:hypothetical protein|tara:strand:+ start:911 stop:1207 length:297 start_codon:yes stop_codon:yes gene_type:complete
MLVFTVACMGMTQILVYGSIFDKVRPTQGWFGKLLSCPMCTGFWTGVFLWAISPFTELFTFDPSIVTGFVLGCYSSIACYFASMLVTDYGLQIKIEKG